MFRFFYTLGLVALSILWLPKLLQSKSRKTLLARFGKGVPSLKSEKATRIWVHAVSVGEAKAVIPLIKKLRKEHPDAHIIFSTTTQTGQAEVARSCPEVNIQLLLPFDIVIRKFIKEAKPTLVILSETDFWYNFLDESKKVGARVVLVNGKLSERSIPLYRYVPALFKRVDFFIVQGKTYQERFIRAGVPSAKIAIGGNLKVEGEHHLDSSQKKSYPIVVIGSTHDPEERLFLDALQSLWQWYPNLKAFIVPRHPERFESVAKLIESYQIPFTRSSTKTDQESRLVLVDEMGKLRSLYSEADICAVAGSWTEKVGGHNILEPSFFAKPVIFGPYMHSQPDFKEQILSAEAGIQVDETEIASTLDFLLQNPYQAKRMGQKGLELVQNSRGALDATWGHLFSPKGD